MTRTKGAARSRQWAACASISLAAMACASAAHAQDRPTSAENSPGIVSNSNILPNAGPPVGNLDNSVNITGVGHMIVRANQNTTGIGVCTGTLINPRTVIFAAHCVNTIPAANYGITTGGRAIAFAFEADALNAIRSYYGLSLGGAFRNRTNTDLNVYNVEQVWYDPRSLALGPSLNFLQADIAIATLDTPAFDIPTWTMLFSPLTQPEHVTINGYGATGSNGTSGANLGLDFRRRVAENVVSFLGSLDDRNNWLFGPAAPFLVQSLYQLDFDNPNGQGVGFDFDLFNGPALPREGTTAGGDSGGPLIVDQKFSKPVVAGVLSGGSRFFGPQPFSSYGTSSFYQPLFLYWDTIVANNPYKYVANLPGTRDWTDPAHWIQTMDPSYAVERNGELVNALPGTPGGALSTNTTKFGEVCFLEDCLNIAQTGPESAGSGAGLVVAGGPGTKNFVPNNVTANPQAGIAARYFDVTLRGPGTTFVSTNITIDRLTIGQPTRLEVKSTGNLRVLGDFTQHVGITTIDGLLRTGEALVAQGVIGGKGTIDPTFLTVLAGAIDPGGRNDFGTFTVKGDLILSPAAFLLVDVTADQADKLVVTGDATNPGIAALDGTIIFSKSGGAAPRHGQSYEVISATGGILGTFDNVLGRQGVLEPTLTYGPNSVTGTFVAGSLAANLQGANAAALSFATALDQLRQSNYNSLYNLYGAVDVMESAALGQTLAGLSPRVTGEAMAMARQQSGVVRSLAADRLSLLGTERAQTGSLAILGAPETLGLAIGQTGLSGSSASQMSFARRYTGSPGTFGRLPETMSGFVSGGFENGARSFAGAGASAQRSAWHIAMGLEMEAAPDLTLGTAFGIVHGRSMLTGAEAETDTSQAVGYGAYRLGGGAYLAGLASVSHSRIGVQRGVTTGVDRFSLNGTSRALTYDVQAEAGVALDVAKGMTLTPKASLRYSANSLKGFRERGGELALLIDKVSDKRLDARLGASFSGSAEIGNGWTFSPQLSADMVRTVAGGNSGLSVRFAEAAGLAFTLPAFSADRNWTEVRGGVSLDRGPLSLGAAIQSDIGRDDYRDNRAVANLTVRF